MNRELARADEMDMVALHVDEYSYERVLVFHGPNGIGKSWLLNEMQAALKLRRPNAIAVWVNCGALAKEPWQMLLFIRSLLSTNAPKTITRPKFLAFAIAVLTYVLKQFGKVRMEELEKQLTDYSDSNVRKLLAHAAKVFKVSGFLETYETAAAVLEPLAEAKLPDLLRLAREMEFKGDYENKDELALFDSMKNAEARHIEEKLGVFLAADIRALLVTQGTSLVLLLDNYNEMWSEESKQRFAGPQRPDWPLFSLMEGRSDAIFVVGDTTDHLWAETALPTNLAGAVKSQALKPWSRQAQLEYLEAHKLSAPALQEAVIDESSGHPLWLKWAVAVYADLVSRGVEVNASALHHDSDDIIGVLRKGLTDAELQTAKHISVAVWLDARLFAHLVGGELATGFAPLSFEEFGRRSVVRMDAQTKTLAIHSAFRTPLLAWMEANEAELLQRLNQAKTSFLENQGTLLAMTQQVVEGHDRLFWVLRSVGRNPAAKEHFDLFLREDLDSTFMAAQGLQVEIAARKTVVDELVELNIQQKKRFDEFRAHQLQILGLSEEQCQEKERQRLAAAAPQAAELHEAATDSEDSATPAGSPPNEEFQPSGSDALPSSEQQGPSPGLLRRIGQRMRTWLQ